MEKKFDVKVTKLGKMVNTYRDWCDWLNNTLDVTPKDLITLEKTINEYKASAHLSKEHKKLLDDFYVLSEQAKFKQNFPSYGPEYLKAVTPLKNEDPEIRYHAFLHLYSEIEGGENEKMITFLDNLDPDLIEELTTRYYKYDEDSPKHIREVMEGYGVERFFEQFRRSLPEEKRRPA